MLKRFALLLLILVIPLANVKAVIPDIFNTATAVMQNYDGFVESVPEERYLWPLPLEPRLSQGPHYGGGIDMAALVGTPLLAAKSGAVIYTGELPDTGYTVMILTGDNRIILYGHCSKFLVEIGDNVKQGDIVALSGGFPGEPGAGRTTGPHLHFQIFGWENNTLVLLNTSIELFGENLLEFLVPERLVRLVRGSVIQLCETHGKTLMEME
jgi:murein DD-endopeptidase MepM/ murein hydrolase activator NlpD